MKNTGSSIFSSLQNLSQTESRILEFISSNKRQFLFMSIGQVAETVRTSEATVSRFARHAGFDDFKSLKQALINEELEEGPAKKLSATIVSGNGGLFRTFMEKQEENIHKTLENAGHEDIDKAVSLIESAARIFIYAKNASSSLACLLEYRLRRLSFDVHIIKAVPEGLAELKKEDAVIIFSFSKLSDEASVILDYAGNEGIKTILFTSKLYLGENEKGDVNLYVYRGEAGEFHSSSAPAAFVDALVLCLSAQLGEKAVSSLEKLDRLKETYRKKLAEVQAR